MNEIFESKLDIFLVLIILVSAVLFIGGSFFSFTGKAFSINAPSNVSILSYFSISLGENLSPGVDFGEVVFLPVVDTNATHNYDGISNVTTYTVNVSSDSNFAVDFCVLANSGLTDTGGDVIGLSNETYSAENFTNASFPSILNKTSLSTGYVKAQNYTGIGNSSFWRFWLSVPASQPSGKYNNTISFKGVQTGDPC